jgi:formylmethanofuran dehydrogenase subunit E
MAGLYPHPIKNQYLTGEQIDEIIRAAAVWHRGRLTIGLACGIRAAFRALEELGLDRNRSELTKVELRTGFCFGQGVEVVLGITALKGKLFFSHYTGSDGELRVTAAGKTVTIRMKERVFQTGEEALAAADEALFEAIVLSDSCSVL